MAHSQRRRFICIFSLSLRRLLCVVRRLNRIRSARPDDTIWTCQTSESESRSKDAHRTRWLWCDCHLTLRLIDAHRFLEPRWSQNLIEAWCQDASKTYISRRSCPIVPFANTLCLTGYLLRMSISRNVEYCTREWRKPINHQVTHTHTHTTWYKSVTTNSWVWKGKVWTDNIFPEMSLNSKCYY